MYDVIVIGAGPAGLFAADKLADNNLKVLVVDKGKDIKKRKCKINSTRMGCLKCKTCDIMFGVGGAGAFSDGKLIFSTKIGIFMDQLEITDEQAAKYMERVENIFLDCGIDKTIYGTSKRVKEWLKRTEKVDELVKLNNPNKTPSIKLVPSKQRHIGSDNTPLVIGRFKEKLEAKGVTFKLNFEVQEILKNDNFYIKRGTEIEQSKYLIVAPGRGGAYWFRDTAHKLGIKTAFGPIDVGVRVEVLAKDMDEITKVIYDPKFWIDTPTYGDRVRTFCTNPRGFVTIEQFENMQIVNGHAMRNKRTKNTNFAMLSTINLTKPIVDTTEYGRNIARFCNYIADGKPIIQKLGDLKRGGRSYQKGIDKNVVRQTLKTVCTGDLGLAYNYRIIINILEGLQMLNMVIPGVYKDSTLLYAPEVKFYDTRYTTDSNLQTNVPGLYVAGDGAGKSRGIVGAAVTGILAAEGVIRNS